LDWTPERLAAAGALKRAGYTYNELASHLTEEWGEQIACDQVRMAFQYHNIDTRIQTERYDKFWRLTGDWMICGDPHCPFVDWQMAEQVAARASNYSIRKLLIGGDVFDMQAMSVYSAIVPRARIGAQEAAAEYLIQSWSEQFDEIDMILGNHDCRLLRLLNGAMPDSTFEDIFMSLMGNPDKVRISTYAYAIIESEHGDWRVTHPRNYSRVPLSMARQLAHKYHQHIVSFHEHHDAEGFDTSGDYVVRNVGCLADPEKFAYVQLVDSTAPKMMQSFGMIKNGKWRGWHKHPALL